MPCCAVTWPRGSRASPSLTGIEPPSEPDDPLADLADAPFGLVDDDEVVAAATAASDEARDDPAGLAAFLAVVDEAASRLVDHPVRPRINASPQGLLRGELDL